MKQLFVTLFCLHNISLAAQTKEIDQAHYKSAIGWLESKLNYVYYDEEDQRWWKNTFYENEDQEITIKHIASDKPNTANIRQKTYTVRTFKIQDIDPNSLKVSNVKKSRGRIVKGQMLELRTFGYQNSISKTINNQRASRTSFLFISFPVSLTDSLANYAEIVREKFAEAIEASTQVYPQDYEHDVARVLKILTGNFQSNAGSVWDAKPEQPHLLRLDRGTGETEYFGYDTKQDRFYLLTLSSQGIHTDFFRLTNERKIQLIGEGNESIFHIGNLNAFEFGNETYFRK